MRSSARMLVHQQGDPQGKETPVAGFTLKVQQRVPRSYGTPRVYEFASVCGVSFLLCTFYWNIVDLQCCDNVCVLMKKCQQC